jgi:hypothetical protein
MEMWQRLGRLKMSCDFAILGKVIRNKGRFLVVDSSEGDLRVVVICLTLTTSNSRLSSPSEISLAGVLSGRWRITAFMGFWDLGEKGIVGKAVLGKVGFHGFEIRHAFDDDSCSVSCATELKIALNHVFQLLLQLN